MFSTLKTLFNGANARAEEAVRDQFALELIDQKVREAEAGLKAAKSTLATPIQRKRSEERQLDGLTARTQDLTARAKAALEDGNETMAREAASAIAVMENEAAVRRETLERLEQRVMRLQGSLEAGHRRIIDLKQGAITARAVRREADTQRSLRSSIGTSAAVDEAEALIARVVEQDDPFEQSQILSDINAGLDHTNLAERMADQGYGAAGKSTAHSVLDRLKQG